MSTVCGCLSLPLSHSVFLCEGLFKWQVELINAHYTYSQLPIIETYFRIEFEICATLTDIIFIFNYLMTNWCIWWEVNGAILI